LSECHRISANMMLLSEMYQQKSSYVSQHMTVVSFIFCVV